ncbi:MAG: hypothetical protein JXB17_10100 [Bacteroidales bacterium]|nr:hypothetical protein [Bacteroidales bacterium]
MKHYYYLTFGILAIVAILISMSEPVYYEYTPVLMNRESIEKSVYTTSAIAINKTGKIYVKDSLFFISEKQKGVHVINNANPAVPINTGFINVPGCVDIAVKGNILYLDNAVDLIAVDISEYPDITITERIKNIFPESCPPGYDYIPDKYLPSNRPKNTVIVRWIKKGEAEL